MRTLDLYPLSFLAIIVFGKHIEWETYILFYSHTVEQGRTLKEHTNLLPQFSALLIVKFKYVLVAV